MAGIANLIYRLLHCRQRARDRAVFDDARELALARLEQEIADFSFYRNATF